MVKGRQEKPRTSLEEEGCTPISKRNDVQDGVNIIGSPSTLLKDDFGAFISNFTLLPPASLHIVSNPPVLDGLTFAVKDIFDVEGHVTGFGNPDWARTHGPAKRTAPAVQILLEAGATCIGKVHMDEMAYSILGENVHYGTPINPASPSRMPGGSSSGSGVAVAAKLVDFSLGTDTGGSVRVPASFCGILGFRPSHGGVWTVGVTPMSQSLDTVGWFARDVTTLCKVGHFLLNSNIPQELTQPRRFLIAEDCFQMSSAPNDKRVHIITRSIRSICGDQALQRIDLGKYIASKVFSLKELEEKMGGNIENGPLGILEDALGHILRWEFKMNHEEWINSVKPDLGADIAYSVHKAMNTTLHLMTLALQVKEETRHAINELLKGDVILVMPTAPGPPPLLKAQGEEFERYRAKAFSLLSVSVLSSCCQVSIPTGTIDSGPVAVSLLARQGSDHLLLNTTKTLYSKVQEEVKVDT